MSRSVRSNSPVEGTAEPVVTLTRRRIDSLFIALGTVAVVVLAVAGGLLTWGANFTRGYVDDELSSQNITFPPAAVLEAEATAVSGQRATLFKGETLRGLLLSAYAWATVGRIAGIAAMAAFAAAALMLVALGLRHHRTIAARVTRASGACPHSGTRNRALSAPFLVPERDAVTAARSTATPGDR